MKRIGHLLLVCSQFLLASACSGDDDSEGGDDGYELLLEHEWQVAARGEVYWCVRQTLTEDLIISGFEGSAPPGTHHAVLSSGTPLQDDGASECTPFLHNFENLAFETAIGADRFEMPEGLAVKLSAGEQINLNFHILNASDSAISGVTGVKIKRADPATVEQYARSIYIGKLSLDIPPQQETTLSSDCILDTDVTAFGVLPHMHKLGTHMAVSAEGPTGGEQVLIDEPFVWEGKVYSPIDPMPLKRDDLLKISCTWFNDTNETIHWGEAFEQEMCFAGIYVYPAEGVTGFCAR